MLPDKRVKKEFRAEASKYPDKYYATKTLREEGFHRKKCSCRTYFWSVDKARAVCGDPACSGGFTFFDGKPSGKSFDYVGTWNAFRKLFEKKGYTAIPRYSVVARWRDDTDFVQASIYDFQPYVVNGEIDPPAKSLVVPQFCLRFNDVDNVGVTMSHHTGFVMVGQHAFNSEKEWDQEKYFKDLLEWFTVGVGLPKEDIVLHEDAWAGGGNFGPCMEFFSKGVELANQVYMLYEQTDEGNKELKLKVLDMGMGLERVAWFSQGKGTIYDAAFPGVVKKLFERTRVEYDDDFIKKYLPLASYLNIDETDDVESSWNKVARGVGLKTDALKKKLLPLVALYSVAEHSRSLLVALSDGALPSNVKGGYNLRVILRRALQFLDEYEWDVDLYEVCEWHAEYLKPIFPELSDNLDQVKKILSVEKKKYYESRERSAKLVEKMVKSGSVSSEQLLELYDSHGVTPEAVKKEAAKHSVKVEVPDNFYALVSERHEAKEQSTQTKRNSFAVKNVEGFPKTALLYYDHYDLVDFKAKVSGIAVENGRVFVVLDKTAFYPTSGGQVHDEGLIGKSKVLDVFRQGQVVLHEVDKASFKEGDIVSCRVDFDRRMQLAQHHTATHVLTGSAYRVLGRHVWQAGAAKTVDKSRLDITHYDSISDEELKKIEDTANSIVRENLPVYKSFMKRNLAESKYSVRIYQGGAVPGKELRIVEIPGFDVEACGGTHLDLTGDIGSIKIIRTSKIQDGIVRLEFVAGAAAEKHFEEERKIISESKELLECTEKQVPGRAEELFEKWKKARKGKLGSFKLESTEEYNGDVIKKTSEVLRTQPSFIVRTLKRFKEEINKKI